MKKTLPGMLLDLLYPRRCPVCDRPVRPFGSLVCETCEQKFEYISAPYCMKCGKELGEEGDEYCGDCIRHSHVFDRGRALFVYKSMADSIYRFKYKGRQEYGDYYGACMGEYLGKWIRQCSPDGLVPVPVHESRRRLRGYNQAEVLAKKLGEVLDIPVYSDLIRRVRKTAPMKDLSVTDRQNNLKRAFKICRNDVKLSTIVIIDDIYTTGSTIDAMSYELRRAGAERIYFVTLAIGKGL